MPTLDITIEGMHCGGCVKRVQDALQKSPAQLPKRVGIGHARVKTDTAPPEIILAALERLGFGARLTPAPGAK